MARVKGRALPCKAKPQGAAQTCLQHQHSLQLRPAWMAVLEIPRVTFGSTHKPPTPVLPTGLTLGSQRYSCGLGYPRGIAAFGLVCEIAEGWWEGLKYGNSNGLENKILIFLCRDS